MLEISENALQHIKPLAQEVSRASIYMDYVHPWSWAEEAARFTFSSTLVTKVVVRGYRTIQYGISDGIYAPRTILNGMSTLCAAGTVICDVAGIKRPKVMPTLYGLAIGFGFTADEQDEKVLGWDLIRSFLF